MTNLVSNKHYTLVSQDNIDNPTAQMLAHPEITYILQEAPYTRYVSNGTTLVRAGDDIRIGGYKTVLFGDSMTSQFHADMTITSVSYAASTGVLTLTRNSHGVADQWEGDLFSTNLSYTSLRKHLRKTFTRVDANTLTCQLDANLSDLPDGVLSGSTFVRWPHLFGSNSWVLRMQQLLGWPFHIVANGAQSGDTTAQVLDRIWDYCLDYNPEVVIMQCPGINDFALTAGDLETTWNNLRTIFDLLMARDIFLVIATITPCVSPETLRVGKVNGARIVEINRRIRQYLQNANAIVIDAYGQVVDIDDAEGEALSNTLKTNDGVHYQNNGAFLVGRKAATALANYGLTNFDSRPRSNIDCVENSSVTASSVTITDGIATFNATAHGFRAGEWVLISGATPTGLNGRVAIIQRVDANSFTFATTASGTVTGTVKATLSRNLFNNPVLGVTSGGATANGITGTVAANLRARNAISSNIAAVCSVVSHSEGFGNWQRMVVGNCAAGDLPSIYTETQSSMIGYLQAGKKYVMECEAKISAPDWPSNEINEVVATLNIAIGGVTYQLDTSDAGAASRAAIRENTTLHLRTPAVDLPAGTVTAYYGRVMIRPIAAGVGIVTSVTLDVGRIAVWEMPDDYNGV